MKQWDMQTEITAQVLCPKNKLFKALESQGFLFKEEFVLVDYYYTHLDITPDTKYQVLAENSFMIRDVNTNRRYFRSDPSMLMYKVKSFDAQGNVVGEDKITCDIANVDAANQIFDAAGMKNWCIKSIIGYVFKNANKEVLVQEVDDLGLFIEIEEFEGQSGSAEEKRKELISYAKGLNIPLGEDFSVKINYLLFQKSMKEKYGKVAVVLPKLSRR